MMRKILYIVAAAWVLAFIWQTYGHANDQLPDAMMGIWCRTQLTPSFDTYVRGTCEEDDDELIFIHKDSYEEVHYFSDSCVFEKIEKTFDAYIIYPHCKEPNLHIVEEAQIIGGELVIRNIPEG
jgi:hypothetical protein